MKSVSTLFSLWNWVHIYAFIASKADSKILTCQCFLADMFPRQKTQLHILCFPLSPKKQVHNAAAVILFILKFSSSPPILKIANETFVSITPSQQTNNRTPLSIAPVCCSAPLISPTGNYVCLYVQAFRRQRSRSKSALTAIHCKCFVGLQRTFWTPLSFNVETPPRKLSTRKICSALGTKLSTPELLAYKKAHLHWELTTPLEIKSTVLLYSLYR